MFNGRQLLVLRVYNSPVYEKAKVPKVDSLTEVEQDANEGLKMGLSWWQCGRSKKTQERN